MFVIIQVVNIIDWYDKSQPVISFITLPVPALAFSDHFDNRQSTTLKSQIPQQFRPLVVIISESLYSTFIKQDHK
jgi:hypothetical protein